MKLDSILKLLVGIGSTVAEIEQEEERIKNIPNEKIPSEYNPNEVRMNLLSTLRTYKKAAQEKESGVA